MKLRLKQAILAVGVLASLGGCLLVGRPALAEVTCPAGTIVGDSSGKKTRPTYAECNIDSGDATTDTLLDVVKRIINVVLGLLGVVAVVVIIYGGYTFTASQGDAGRVMKGRNTILWGVVGLVVALMAFTIVNFVLDNVTGSVPDNVPAETPVQNKNDPAETPMRDENKPASTPVLDESASGGTPMR